jgi:hypothetical protein
MAFSSERWLQPSSRQLEEYLIPFSKGPRACLGSKYAHSLFLIFVVLVLTFVLVWGGPNYISFSAMLLDTEIYNTTFVFVITVACSQLTQVHLYAALTTLNSTTTGTLV